MKRTLLVALALAFCASAASAQNFDCRKAKANPKFAGSTALSVDSAFASQSNVLVKKPFLYCDEASLNGGASGSSKQVCYKVKGTKTADAPAATTDAFGSLSLTVKSKTFVLCVPAT